MVAVKYNNQTVHFDKIITKVILSLILIFAFSSYILSAVTETLLEGQQTKLHKILARQIKYRLGSKIVSNFCNTSKLQFEIN
jgi:hypothetical protein